MPLLRAKDVRVDVRSCVHEDCSTDTCYLATYLHKQHISSVCHMYALVSTQLYIYAINPKTHPQTEYNRCLWYVIVQGYNSV